MSSQDTYIYINSNEMIYLNGYSDVYMKSCALIELNISKKTTPNNSRTNTSEQWTSLIIELVI